MCVFSIEIIYAKRIINVMSDIISDKDIIWTCYVIKSIELISLYAELKYKWFI